jgi:RNA polymerase sigma-70 factor, ECF subfamily
VDQRSDASMAQAAHAPSPDPDLALIRAIANGDKSALDELYNRHGRYILAYLIGQLNNQQQAEEVLQDVMLATWRGAGGFRGESRVKTWLIAIARLKSLNVLRRRKPTPGMLHENLAATDTGPMQRVEVNDERAQVRKAMQKLPRDQRETLELVFFHDMTGPEAARLLGAYHQGRLKAGCIVPRRPCAAFCSTWKAVKREDLGRSFI